MAGEIYTIITGDNRYYWPNCVEGKLVSMSFDQPYFDAWKSGDGSAHLAVAGQDKANKSKNDASVSDLSKRWWRYAQTLANSEDDVFISRIGDDLYWTETTAAPVFFEPHKDPQNGRDVVAICKPVTGWSRLDGKTRKLQWRTTHKQVHAFLSQLPALARVDNADIRGYLFAMVAGDDLSHWHKKPEWIARQGNNSLTVSSSLYELAVENMVATIFKTVKYSNGQLVETTVKDKQLKDCNGDQMKARLAFLLEQQKGICKLTGIRMHLPGQDNLDKDFLPSADRIDSDGHNELENMQVVCRFINHWKSSMPDKRFRDLLDTVVAAKTTIG
jgi:hypothetical protein